MGHADPWPHPRAPRSPRRVVRVGPPAEAPRAVAGAARDCSGRFFVGPGGQNTLRGRAGSGSHPRSEVGEISQQKLRVNEQIRISPVRLIQDDGAQVGIVSIEEARQRADERGMDLVEVAPDSRPPVVKMMDYGKFRYEQQRASREARRKQHTAQVKEVKFRPGIEKHDYEFKTRHARRFLEEGNKVKLTMMFRGRQVTHPEIGLEVLARVAEDLQDVSVAESQPSFEGRVMSMMLAPARTR